MESSAIADGIIQLTTNSFQKTNPELLSECLHFLADNDINGPDFNKKLPGIISGAFGMNKPLDITSRDNDKQAFDKLHEEWEKAVNSFGANNPKMDGALKKLKKDLLAALA